MRDDIDEQFETRLEAIEENVEWIREHRDEREAFVRLGLIKADCQWMQAHHRGSPIGGLSEDD